jgi:hypothetical protein
LESGFDSPIPTRPVDSIVNAPTALVVPSGAKYGPMCICLLWLPIIVAVTPLLCGSASATANMGLKSEPVLVSLYLLATIKASFTEVCVVE